MVPRTNTSSSRPSPSTFSTVASYLSSIRQRFLSVVHFLCATWSFIVSAYAEFRELTSRKAFKEYGYIIRETCEDEDIGFYTLASCCHILLAVVIMIELLVLFFLSFIRFEPIQTSVKNAQDYVWESRLQHAKFTKWLTKPSTTYYDTILVMHEHKQRAIRRSKRWITWFFSALIHVCLPGTLIRTALRFARIFDIWSPTSFDYYIQYVRCGGPDLEVKNCVRPGFIRVRLGFPTRQPTVDDESWCLSTRIHMIEDFPLACDGSLDLTLVMQRWHLQSLVILDPNRFQPFDTREANRVSLMALGVLSMRDGYITVVEGRDWFLRKSMQLRQTLMASLMYFLVRVAAFFASMAGGLYTIWMSRNVHALVPIPAGLVVGIVLTHYAWHQHEASYQWRPWPRRYSNGYVASQKTTQRAALDLWMKY